MILAPVLVAICMLDLWCNFCLELVVFFPQFFFQLLGFFSFSFALSAKVLEESLGSSLNNKEIVLIC